MDKTLEQIARDWNGKIKINNFIKAGTVMVHDGIMYMNEKDYNLYKENSITISIKPFKVYSGKVY